MFCLVSVRHGIRSHLWTFFNTMHCSPLSVCDMGEIGAGSQHLETVTDVYACIISTIRAGQNSV